MELLLAIVAGVLYATGLYLMLRRRLAQLIIGLGLLSNGSNILILSAAGVTRASRRSSTAGTCAADQFADPVPQSLILTAIVIGFGVLAFALVLAHRVHSPPARTTSTRLDRIGVMLLALPILVPLRPPSRCTCCRSTRRLLRVVAFGGAVCCPRPRCVRFSCASSAQAFRCCRSASWPAPFGITLVADLFSAVMVVMVGIIGVAVTASSFAGVDPRREAFGYHPLIHVLLMGVSGAFLTGDIFNLYVWFEVMLIGSFVLMSLHRTRAQLHAAFTYVGLNLLASAFLLTAIGLLYGQAGTLNFADLARAWPERRTPGLDAALSMLFLTAFGIKAGLFPLVLLAARLVSHAAGGRRRAPRRTADEGGRLRDDPRLHAAVSRSDGQRLHRAAGAVGVTMVVGLVGALGQRDFRRVLSFNLVGHIGFTTVGLALWTPAALGGSILYVLHHMLVISTLFLVSGLFLRQRRTTDLRLLGGLYRAQPCRRVSRDGPAVLAGRHSAAVRIHREARGGGADDWTGTVRARGDRAGGEPVDRTVDGAGLGGGVLEAGGGDMPRTGSSRVWARRSSRRWHCW